MTILGQNVKKFEISSNFQKIFHKDKSSQNGLFSIGCKFLQKKEKKFDIAQNLRQ